MLISLLCCAGEASLAMDIDVITAQLDGRSSLSKKRVVLLHYIQGRPHSDHVDNKRGHLHNHDHDHNHNHNYQYIQARDIYSHLYLPFPIIAAMLNLVLRWQGSRSSSWGRGVGVAVVGTGVGVAVIGNGVRLAVVVGS